jgi:hypothetical protein
VGEGQEVWLEDRFYNPVGLRDADRRRCRFLQPLAGKKSGSVFCHHPSDEGFQGFASLLGTKIPGLTSSSANAEMVDWVLYGSIERRERFSG